MSAVLTALYRFVKARAARQNRNAVGLVLMKILSKTRTDLTAFHSVKMMRVNAGGQD